MKKIFILIIAAAMLIGGCASDVKPINSLDDLKTARIGTWDVSAYEVHAREALPDAKFVPLNMLSDLVENLKQHKVDAFALGKIYAESMKREGIAIDYLPQTLGDVPIGYIFSKTERGQTLCTQMNEFMDKVTANGELDALQNKWIFGDDSERTFTKTAGNGVNGTLKICTDADSPPFDFLREGQVVGYEVELLDKFCAAYGYDYEIKIEVFDTMLVDVSSGKVDIGMNAIEKMPEREKAFLFSKPTYIDQTVVIINSKSAGNENFFTALVDRLRNSLVAEGRWQMILEGAARTLAVTIASIICGTILGFAVYMLYREGNRLVNKIIDAIYRTLQGVPTMVLLLFFYYVVFGSVNLPPIIVAVTVFAIVLSISVFIMLKSGAESIPRGQTEAALSLGFSRRRAFVKFILPQIIRSYFQPYQLALNTILLETAIVGYISVQDLTKMADLIRARTFDAFVPIVTVAVVYLILSRLLMKFTDIIARRIDPKSRSREKILEGMKI